MPLGDDRPWRYTVRDALLATVCFLVLFGALIGVTTVIAEATVEFLTTVADGFDASP
jgi:hypothetical protein